MGVGRKSGGVEAKDVLTAIVLADSFTQRFRPVTVERPKVLLPLANVPLLDAVLDWLARSGVEEVLVFCCAHAEAVTEHVERGRWKAGRGLRRVTTVVGANCLSVGDALRAVDQRGGMPSDFVLVAGDSVCNADLGAAVAAHRARRAQDRLAIATLVLKGGVTRAEADRMGVDTLQAAVDPRDGRLLKLEKTRKITGTVTLDAAAGQGGGAAQDERSRWATPDPARDPATSAPPRDPAASARPDPSRDPAPAPSARAGPAVAPPGGYSSLPRPPPPPQAFSSPRAVACAAPLSAPRPATFDPSQLAGRPGGLELRADLADVGVAVLAPEALMLFTDNFDYQDVCGDFVSGVLSEEELGNKIHVHVLERNSYAARIDTFKTYAAVTADVLARRLYPFAPDVTKAAGGARTGGAAAAAAAALAAASATPNAAAGINASFTVPHGLPAGVGGAAAQPVAQTALRAGGLAGALGAAAGGVGGPAAAALAVAPGPEAASPPSRPAYRPAAPTGDRVIYNRGDVYVDASAKVARDARLGPGTLVGAGATVGPGALVAGSVLGRGAFVGARARVLDSVLLDDARVHADAWVSHALLCDRAVAREGSRVGPDVILGFGVVVADGFAAPPGARVSLARQRAPAAGDDSDDDVEAPGGFGAAAAGGSSQAARRLARRSQQGGEPSSPSPRSPVPSGLRAQGSGAGLASSYGAASFGGASFGAGSYGDGDEDSPWSAAAPSDRAVAAAAALARGRAPPEGSPAFDAAVVGPGGAGYAWIPPGDYDPLRHGLKDLGSRADRIRRYAAAKAAAAAAGAAAYHARSASLTAQPLGASPTQAPSRLGGRAVAPAAAAAAPAARPSAPPSPSSAWLAAESAADADDDAYFGDAAARAAALARAQASGSAPGTPSSALLSQQAPGAAPGAALPPHLLNRSRPRPLGPGAHRDARLGTSPATPGALAGEGSQSGSAAPSPATRWGALGAAAGGSGAGPSSGAGMATASDAAFKREVAETLLRSIAERIAAENVVIELNGLKIAEDRTFADCARFMITTLLGLQLAAPPGTPREYRSLYPASPPDASTRAGLSAVVGGAVKALSTWKGLLARFAGPEDDQVELLLTLEEYCGNEGDFRGEGGDAYAPAFARLLQALYEEDVISEAAFLQWADEKKNADAEDRVFLDRAKPFLDWLAQAEEDDSDDDSEEEEDDDDEEDDSDESSDEE